jgi:hypothetical protein
MLEGMYHVRVSLGRDGRIGSDRNRVGSVGEDNTQGPSSMTMRRPTSCVAAARPVARPVEEGRDLWLVRRHRDGCWYCRRTNARPSQGVKGKDRRCIDGFKKDTKGAASASALIHNKRQGRSWRAASSSFDMKPRSMQASSSPVEERISVPGDGCCMSGAVIFLESSSPVCHPKARKVRTGSHGAQQHLSSRCSIYTQLLNRMGLATFRDKSDGWNYW